VTSRTTPLQRQPQQQSHTANSSEYYDTDEPSPKLVASVNTPIQFSHVKPVLLPPHPASTASTAPPLPSTCKSTSITKSSPIKSTPPAGSVVKSTPQPQPQAGHSSE
jgi:hypothetical protein